MRQPLGTSVIYSPMSPYSYIFANMKHLTNITSCGSYREGGDIRLEISHVHKVYIPYPVTYWVLLLFFLVRNIFNQWFKPKGQCL